MTDAAAPARYQAWRWWTGAATAAAAAAMIVRIVSAVTRCSCCCGGGGRDLGFKPMITRLTARGEGRGRDFFWLEGSGGARIEFFPTRARPIDAYAIHGVLKMAKEFRETRADGQMEPLCGYLKYVILLYARALNCVCLRKELPENSPA